MRSSSAIRGSIDGLIDRNAFLAICAVAFEEPLRLLCVVNEPKQ